VQCILKHLCDDARTLGRAVTIAIAVSAPFECKGGGAHGGVMVLVATVGTVIESFKGTPKAWSGYWPSLAFRCRSGDMYSSIRGIYCCPNGSIPARALHCTLLLSFSLGITYPLSPQVYPKCREAVLLCPIKLFRSRDRPCHVHIFPFN